MTIDYSKWDKVDIDATDGNKGDTDHDQLLLGGRKLKADELFKIAESSDDLYDYKVALKAYEEILTQLTGMNFIESNESSIQSQFKVSCELNSACCFLQLQQWDDVIKVCSDILRKHESIINVEQKLRVRYFRSYSYYHGTTVDGILDAEADAFVMSTLLSSEKSNDKKMQYLQYFQTLREARLKLNLAHEETQSKKKSVKQQSNYDFFYGLGETESQLNRNVEAAEAFVEAVLHTNSGTAKCELFIRAGALYFKSTKYDLSISCYTTALMLAKDLSSFTTTLDSPFAATQSTSADTSIILIMAISNSGLGSCHFKMHKYSTSIDHLKIAIGYLTDDFFISKKNIENCFSGELFSKKQEVLLRSNLKLYDTPMDEKGMGERDFLSLSMEVNHLLNALESLSDVYAVTRDWEKAIYTANHVIEVYGVLIGTLNENGSNVNTNEDTVIPDNLKSPIIIKRPKSKLILKDFIRNVFTYNPTCPDKKNIDKNLFVLNLRRRKAMTILSKGHMIKNSLNYDITQNNSFGGDNHDTETSTFRFPSSSVIRDPSCNASMTDNQEIITAINLIAVLWNEAATEFENLNEYQESLSIYKVLATLWGNLVEFQPYSKILIDFNSRLLQQNKDGIASNLESSTFDPELNITYASLLPLQLNSAINSNQIDAAKKGWMAWNSAARIAHKICDMRTIEKVREVDFELLLWNQVIFCKYKAGLCAMVYDTQIAQSEFELAQSFKAKYDELAGSLIVDLPDIQASHQNDIDNSAVIRLSTQPRKKKMVLQSAQQRQQWIAYNTLCCDISYHLGHTYLRTGNFAYAIAEAEMAIALAMFSSEMKVRQRKAWGLLALGMSTGLQMGEAFKALNEVSKIKIPLENMEDDESQLRSSMKFIVDERNITHGITSDDTRKDSSFIKHEMKINLKSNIFNDFINGNKNQSQIISVFVVMIATLIGFFYFYRNIFFRWLEYCGHLFLEYFII